VSALVGLVCVLGLSACAARAVTVTGQRAHVSPASATPGGSAPAVPGTSTAAAAASCRSGSGFALSLVSDTGGQPTPILAAIWFGRHGGVPGIPTGGWRQVSHNGASAVVKSGDVTLHVVQGPDRTWQVDSGERCD